jgi:hypothetical protein
MLETLRAWLNGKRDYNTGVALYAQLGANKELLALLKKGANEFREKRLHEELLIICNELKSKKNGKTILPETCMDKGAAGNNKSTGEPKSDNRNGEVGTIRATETEKTIDNNARSIILDRSTSSSNLPVNLELYNACKAAADKKYKEIMNLRTRLFILAEPDEFSNPNTAEKINARSKLALDVVLGQHEYSRLYDVADFVKLHGRLPDQEEGDENIEPVIPDHLVKEKLDNARKAFNKLKRREQTPARVALLQQHTINIEKLLPRWRSLQLK